MKQLKEAMLLLIAKDAPLPPEWMDHRECHVGGDFLLIYRLESRGIHEPVIFVRAGTHAELFESKAKPASSFDRPTGQTDPERSLATVRFAEMQFGRMVCFAGLVNTASLGRGAV
jgi:mRNA interferase YafQ